MQLRFTAPLWRYDDAAGWHVVTVPAALSDDVREETGGRARGFGSVRVRASAMTTARDVMTTGADYLDSSSTVMDAAQRLASED